LNPPPAGVQHDSDNNIVDNASWAAFTQWTYKFTDKYSLTVGGRYTEDRKGSYPDQFDYSNPAVKQVPVRWYNETFSSFTPSASFAIQWNDDAMTYFSYSEGFKGGGWNSHFNAVLTPAQQAALQQFQQEEAETMEIGAKFDIGSTLRLNMAVFSSDYTNMQLTYRGPAPAGVAPFITNAGETSIAGAELELTWAPNDAWRVDGSVGYLDATIDSLTNIPLAVLPPGLAEGNFLPYAPELQLHLGLSYEGHLGGLAVTPRIDASHQTETYFDATNTREIAQLEDVTTVNASVRISRHGRAVSDRGEFLADHGQRLCGNRLRPAARVVRELPVRVLKRRCMRRYPRWRAGGRHGAGAGCTFTRPHEADSRHPLQ
jgi:iron complex outermembrane receptor protein